MALNPPRAGVSAARARIDAITRATDAAADFQARVQAAAGDAGLLADLMAEAIDMTLAARGVADREDRTTFTPEENAAAHCMQAVATAYRAAGAGA